MGAVAVGAVFFAVLALVIAGYVWQAVRRSPVTDTAEYLVDEAVPFVWERLSNRAMDALDTELVRRILEWNVHYTQIVGPRELGRPVVIGSGEGMEYVLSRARAAGYEIDPLDVAEVMAIETDYLLEIGAIGAPVAEEDDQR